MTNEEIFLFLTAWVIVSLILGRLGADRQIGFWGVFFSSFFLSPIMGSIVLFASKRIDDVIQQREVLRLLKELGEKK